jgi:trans-aconitate methyltransferase
VGHVEIRKSYGAVADLYVSLFGATESVHEDDLDLIRRHLGTQAGPVLDLGCGPGHLTGYLHDLGTNVTGVDLVPEFIRHAKATHPDISFSVGTLESPDRPAHSWSGILAWYSLIHLPPSEIDSVLNDLRCAIADDGILVTGCFTADHVGPFDHKVLTAYQWPVDEFVQRLMGAGFVELERLERPADGPVRAHAAVAARAV